MKNTNYFVIQGWMINELKLGGTNLMIYAIIYGFSQDENSSYTGSLAYLASWVNASKPTVIKALKELVDLELIYKHTEVKNKIIFNSYKVLTVVKELYGGSKEPLQGGSKEPLLNNKQYIHKEINNKKNKQKKTEIITKMERTKPSKIKESISAKSTLPNFYFDYGFFTNDFSKIWFDEFLPLKKRKKAAITERALNSQLKKISNYSQNNYDTALEILENSVNAGWSDFYPLKNKTNYTPTNKLGSRSQTSHTIDYSSKGKKILHFSEMS